MLSSNIVRGAARGASVPGFRGIQTAAPQISQRLVSPYPSPAYPSYEYRTYPQPYSIPFQQEYPLQWNGILPSFSPTQQTDRKRPLDDDDPRASNVKKSKSIAPWKDDVEDYCPKSASSIHAKSLELDEKLKFLVDASAGEAADVFVDAFRRLPESAQLQIAEKILDTKETSNALNVVQSIRDFCNKPQHVSSSGPLYKPLQNMMNAITTACVYHNTSGAKVPYYAKLLGVCSQSVRKAMDYAETIQDDNDCFDWFLGGHTSTFDNLQLDKLWCVYSFQHSPEGSRVDTNTFYNYDVCDPAGNVQSHPRRNWRECGLDQAYDRFTESSMYISFLASHPGKKICKTTFKAMLCKCTTDPTEHSCVDTIYSQINQFCIALMEVLLSDEEVKKARARLQVQCMRVGSR